MHCIKIVKSSGENQPAFGGAINQAPNQSLLDYLQITPLQKMMIHKPPFTQTVDYCTSVYRNYKNNHSFLQWGYTSVSDLTELY